MGKSCSQGQTVSEQPQEGGNEHKMKKVTLLMVGTGGYAGVYLKTLLHTPVGEQFEIAGAVDPYAGGSEYGRELMGKGVPVFDTVEEFYREHTARLAIIVTPIYLHARQAVTCMEHGSDVLCEKPMCASLQDAEDMIAVRSRTGRRLGIGFQWSFSEGIQAVKRDILDGVYGKVRRIRTIVCFPRDLEYFRRGTGWAGKRRLENGEPVLDSVASNAAAHYLHNMLFLTGEQPDRSGCSPWRQRCTGPIPLKCLTPVLFGFLPQTGRSCFSMPPMPFLRRRNGCRSL